MKRTAFYDKHKAFGARIVEFAGYEMPLEYVGITAEHMAVRNSVGIFDVSHMGEIWVKGPKAKDLLQSVTSNDIDLLAPGKAQYSCFPNGKGGIVDDLIIYQYAENKYFLVVNASNIEKDWNWINTNNKFGAELENVSDNISQLAIQGPNAIKVLQKLTSVKLSEMKPFTFYTGELGGVKDIIIATTGYTGAGGLEIYFDNANASKVWDLIMDAGREYNIQPIGLAARDTLRLEMGYCLYGNDINDRTSPIEAGLGWITHLKPGKNLIDGDKLMNQKNNGVSQRLVGFEMIDRGIPRQHYEICNKSGEKIGEVTSGTMSPVLKMGIGMGYIQTSFANPGSNIYISIRNKLLLANVVKLPFIKN